MCEASSFGFGGLVRGFRARSLSAACFAVSWGSEIVAGLTDSHNVKTAAGSGSAKRPAEVV